MPAKVIDRRGQRFGRWLVMDKEPARQGSATKWFARCACGTERYVDIRSLVKGVSRSCGCLKRELAAKQTAERRTHGHSHSLTWASWSGVIQRCTNPNNRSFPDYGAKGLGVCERWRTFANFLADMGERPSRFHSIDRIDNSRGYEPGNCRWATSKEQSRNRRVNRMATIDGVTRCVADWCDHFGIRARDVHRRTHRGMTPEAAIAAALHPDVPRIVRALSELDARRNA